MELKEGMYVRTKGGYVSKITRHEHYWINKEEWNYITTDINLNFEIESIVKASNNIIDLIEVGDYVNGLKVIEVKEHLHNDKEIVLSNGEFQWSFSKNESDYDIKTIVTKEQFESISYKVGE